MVAHRLAVGGRYDGKSSSAELHRLKLDGPISADGMSGGPVFHLGREGDQFFAGWAGMVVRGGNQSEYLHFVAASFIVDWVLRSPVTETIPRK